MTWINIIAAGSMLWTSVEMLHLAAYLSISEDGESFFDKVSVHNLVDIIIGVGKVAVFSKFLNLW